MHRKHFVSELKRNNVENILAEATKKADDTMKDASEKAKVIIDSASSEKEAMILELKKKLSDLKLSVQNIETSVDIAVSDLDRKAAKQSPIPDDLLKLLKIDPE